MTTLLVVNLVYLPGSNKFFQFAVGIRAFTELFSIFLIIPLLFGLAWSITGILRKSKELAMLFSYLFWTIPLVILLSVFVFGSSSRTFARERVIKSLNKQIKNIESIKQKTGRYPEELPKGNRSGIIGIGDVNYKASSDSFELKFTQNLFIGFNFEIISYIRDNEKSVVADMKRNGNQKQLTETCDPNWKYWVFD